MTLKKDLIKENIELRNKLYEFSNKLMKVKNIMLCARVIPQSKTDPEYEYHRVSNLWVKTIDKVFETD